MSKTSMARAIRDEIKSFETDHLWINENWASLTREYPGKWIAVSDKRVFKSSDTLEGLLEGMEDPSHACVEFVSDDRMEMIH